MFEESGVLWQMMMFLLPNLYSIIIFFASVMVIIILTIVQQLLFFPKPEWSVRSGGLLLLKNGLVMMGGQYLGLVISLVLGFIASMLPYLSVVASEFPMSSPQELVVNQLYAAFSIGLGMLMVFLGSYFITTRKKITGAWKRLLYSTTCAAVVGACVFLGYWLILSSV